MKNASCMFPPSANCIFIYHMKIVSEKKHFSKIVPAFIEIFKVTAYIL